MCYNQLVDRCLGTRVKPIIRIFTALLWDGWLKFLQRWKRKC
nr:MAG TPA: hypothetical protein [Caudoviricetes sp.]